jgi:large subunit ribosomal protein L25
MGEKITLAVSERTVHGKKVKNLRAEGLIPGVIYGHGMEPANVQMVEGDLLRAIERVGKHAPINLTGAKKRIAMIKDIDIDPVRNEVRHVSFHAVKADEPVTAEVSIRLTNEGESEAEKAGLIILQSIDHIEVKALPMDLPEALEVSVLGLKAEGDRLTVGDIKLPANVEFVEHIEQHAADDDIEHEEQASILDLVVANVWEPSALAAANDAAAGDAESASAEDVPAENGEGDVAAKAE